MLYSTSSVSKNRNLSEYSSKVSASPISLVPKSDFPEFQRKYRFENSSLLLNTKEADRVMAEIFNGNVREISRAFLPNEMNAETFLIREIIKKMILNPEDVEFTCEASILDTKVHVNGEVYFIYPILEKVKWDLVTLTKEELDEYSKKTIEGKYPNYGNRGVPAYEFNKKHLYENLHDSEKRAISIYKLSGCTLNSVLRGKTTYRNGIFKEVIIHIAVLVSALNRIPPSVNQYLYRCMGDSDYIDGKSLISSITDKMKKHEKFKEKGFSSLSLFKPLKDFMGYGEDDCIKIYQNPQNMAKDISGIGGYEYENECLLLPNSKDLPLREIVLKRADNQYQSQSDQKTHIIFTKLISKRQNVF